MQWIHFVIFNPVQAFVSSTFGKDNVKYLQNYTNRINQKYQISFKISK